MSTHTIQTRPTAISDADIARGIAAGRRLRSLAIHAALKSAFTALARPIVGSWGGLKSSSQAPHRGTHAAA